MKLLKFFWWLASRMTVMMGMLASSAMSVLFALTAIPDAMNSTPNIIIALWMAGSSAFGIVLYLAFMGYESRRNDSNMRIIDEAERIIKGARQ